MVGATVYAMYMVDRMVIPESLDSRSLSKDLDRGQGWPQTVQSYLLFPG